jgi:hypothetical protein
MSSRLPSRHHSTFSARSLKSPGLAVWEGTRRLALQLSVPLGITNTWISLFSLRAKSRTHQFAALCSGAISTQLTLNRSTSWTTSEMIRTGGKIHANSPPSIKRRQSNIRARHARQPGVNTRLTKRGETCQESEAKRSIAILTPKDEQICSKTSLLIPQSEASGWRLRRSSASKRSRGCQMAVTLNPTLIQSEKTFFRASEMSIAFDLNWLIAWTAP